MARRFQTTRISYVPYPITGVNYYSTYYKPSYSYYPKIYRWYYDWPRDSYYLPYYRYLSTYLNYSSPISRSLQDSFSKIEYDIDNFRVKVQKVGGQKNGIPPKNRVEMQLCNSFKSVLSKYSNCFLTCILKTKKMLTYLRNPISGYEWSFWPDARFYYHYKIYRPLPYYDHYWPRTWSSKYWPSYRSYRYFMEDIPTEKGLTDVRVNEESALLVRQQNINIRFHIETAIKS
ncbi:unnamed protein product [Brassicogethes aeneus]|uniref:Uncharacterized protein n=1 Tax=Brassicogethes aeneus TaxID=1431903 RepID=A0A9P0FEB6_BRAAE|nr:unnamed protein product [Brassicogethes aeneus]